MRSSIQVIIIYRSLRFTIRMKVVVFFAAVCIFALVMPQTYAEEEEEAAVREVRMAGKGV